MSEFARLNEKLAKLRARERATDEKRKLRGSDPDALLAALVTEIDETILPRRLSFQTSGGAVHLAVANRRLQALLPPSPAGVPDNLEGHALPDVEDPKLVELGESLKSLFADADLVTISASRLKSNFGSDIGVPAVQLPRVWSVDAPTAAAPEDILERFLSGLDPKSVGWLRIEGEEVTGQGGEGESTETLGERAAIFLDGYFSKFETAFQQPAYACGTVVALGEALEPAILFVEIDQLSAFVSAPSAEIFSIATKWQKLVAE